jgi:hypothetical protein
LVELATWYAAQCNGEWEHAQGISIRSCDNPGWWVQIDVVGTPLSERQFNSISESVSEEGFPTADRWLRCYVRDGVWHGAGDACHTVGPDRTALSGLGYRWQRSVSAP